MQFNSGQILQSAISCVLAVLAYHYLVAQKGTPKEGTNEKQETSSPPPVEEPSLLEVGSSVWCRGDNIESSFCHFRNLCYHPEKNEYLFLHSEHSIKSGVPLYAEKTPLVRLSSVNEHNLLQLMYTDVPVKTVSSLYDEIHFIVQPSLLLYRFKPDNLMHVFHDDLLPIYFTLLEMCKGNLSRCPDDLQLVFVDPYSEAITWDFYSMFLKIPPLHMASLDPSALYCFKEVSVGLNRQSVWYQYGYDKPQGPIENTAVTSLEIRKFTDFFLSQPEFRDVTPTTCDPLNPIAIIISRKNTRTIVNEEELVQAVKSILEIEPLTMSLDEHSFTDVLSHIRCASYVFGMHGAALVMSMFLSPGSFLFELFPYAINPDNYTPYKTLVTLPGMKVTYNSWRNLDKKNTIAHPDWPATFGGISHLTYDEQEEIKKLTEVQPHICCENPEWLYHIFQDTTVDVTSFKAMIQKSALEKQNENRDKNRGIQSIVKSRMYPGKVQNLTCESLMSDAGLSLSWIKPWNLAEEDLDEVVYEVVTQITGKNDYETQTTNTTNIEVTGLPPRVPVNIWVKTAHHGKVGTFEYIVCTPEEPRVFIKY